jgi:hypothetical protein
MSVEDRIKELGLQLPAAATPVANYMPAKRVGSLLFVAGHGPARSIPVEIEIVIEVEE